MEFNKDHLILAIKKINANPDIRNNRSSSTYDLVYEGKKYPPILVLSVANQLNGKKELFLSDFNNKIDFPFKILRENGFEIVKKEVSYYEELIAFLNQALTDSLKYSKYIKSFVELDVKVSFGQGGSAKIPWISFLREGITTANGIYPIYLYFKKENLLILAYGISETNVPKYKWPLEKSTTIESYFKQNNLENPFRYGKSYIYKIYNVNDLPERDIINNDLIELLNFYKSLELDSKMNLFQNDMKNFNISSYRNHLQNSNLYFSNILALRFVASLTSKPFVILSGLSGSGKTKIAQSFVQWICESNEQYKIVPVGADWTNREPLVGYPNGLVAEEYITPDSGVIHLLMEAVKKGNENKPFFLILDEMNLSHVERYFADFLSIMESNDTIKLYTGNTRESLDGLPIPLEIGWPKNVFIIGTVNIDETTYMFSPKVLDRANVIEFRITDDEIKSFLENPGVPDLTKLTKQGVSMSESFLSIASQNNIVKNEDIAKELVSFFKQLQPVGAEFGYRSASEIMQLAAKLKMLESSITDDECLDIAIMQKLLPKLHGSRSKLVKILIALSGLCVEGITKEEFEKKFDDYYKNGFDGLTIKYPISFEKLIRMYKNVLANGFTSYAEA
jgi:5-methylcytosine-specific restriction protein B